MSVYRNNLKHGINPTGSRRVPPGGVVDAQGDEAKVYEATNGVEKLSGQEAKDALEPRYDGPTSGKSGAMLQEEALAEGRVAARALTVSGPLNVVVGDDEAPYGPPTGTLSTKRDEAQKDLAHRLAFADHEAVEKVSTEGVDPLTPHGVVNGQFVHNDQAEAFDRANDTAELLVEAAEDAKSEGEKPKDDEE